MWKGAACASWELEEDVCEGATAASSTRGVVVVVVSVVRARRKDRLIGAASAFRPGDELGTAEKKFGTYIPCRTPTFLRIIAARMWQA